MSNFVSRDNLADYQRYVDPLPDPPYLLVLPGSPNDILLSTIEPKYLKLEDGSNVIEELTPIEKAAVDQQEKDEALLNNRSAAIDAANDTSSGVGQQNRGLIATFNQRDNYDVNRISELQSAMAAMKASTGDVDNLRAAIPDSFLATNTRDRDDAIDAYRDFVAAGAADDPAPGGPGRSGDAPGGGPPGQGGG